MPQNRYSRITMKSAMLALSAIVLIDCLAVFAAAELTAVVKTTSGPVQGEILATVNSVNYASFKGIKYAKAPVGNLRFKPPVAPDRWTKTLNATNEGPDCPQFGMTGSYGGSEDCLFLNVMTPVTNLIKTPKNLKPVMVWIYGGGFKTGTSSTKLYRPDYLIEKDVVYVAFNYRLGPLGFLSLRHPAATGNAGLKDQVFALKWIRANIRKFGGNPNNVTLFGQSAGGASVGSHVLSDASTGLFHGAISMSGVPMGLNTYQTPEIAETQGKKLAAALGTTSTDKNVILQTLYNASASDIITAANKMSTLFTAFAPTFEDESIATDTFLSECSPIKYFSGKFNKVPQMIGYTDQEAVYYFSPIGPIVQLLSQVLDSYEVYRSEWPQKLIDARDIINSWSGGELGHNELQTLINVTTDIVFKAQIDLTQRILAVNNDNKPIYYYQTSYFTYPGLHNILMNNKLQGAGHVDDLAFLFYFAPLNYPTDPTDPTRRTIDRMTTMWTNFAKYGNPTPNWKGDNSLNMTWPNSGLSGTTLDIGTDLKVRPRLIDDVAKFVQLVNWPLLSKTNGCHA